MKPKKNLLIACTGSVATIKLPLLIEKLRESNIPIHFNISIVVTEHAKHFIDNTTIPLDVIVYDDQKEWSAWNKRGDPVVHIDLGKWADIMVIAPLSANSMAKIVSGICDNLLMCVVRAWDFEKPLYFCPAMNTRMYDHPLTNEQLGKLKNWGYLEIPAISKTLMCGDTGNGAMAEVQTIVDTILKHFKN
ncbi:phosphopantothenoylcysteine decarboxylase [Teleopsis dalmanni]|uniref:phosphopantothenoylcysteine decarboxylase n=1 Tax=Teleopsis dalmanni TaxID=139649 RepID=UPI000D32BB9F|nr:phosphopantothenoylcysteine decarboxylase [Teleopsis dalmanni]